MIVSFSVSNFRSFHGEQTFSLVASKRCANDHPEHTAPIPGSDERVLRAGMLYGANGAGKSNLLKALQFLQTLAVDRGTAVRDPFLFAHTDAEPTTFDLQFIAADRLYRYGLSLDDDRIIDEWLVEVHGDKEEVLYERVTDPHGAVKVSAAALAGDEKLALLAKVGARPEHTFLETVLFATGNAPTNPHRLIDVLLWFGGLWIWKPRIGRDLILMEGMDDDFRVFAEKFLKDASTGVDGIQIANHSKGGGHPANHLSQRVVEMRHNSTHLPLHEESEGTQRLLDLAAAMFLMEGISPFTAVCLLDELERSLHPMLVHGFLESFFKLPSNRSQLVATTHDSNILDLDLLRRDEIWFAEKDPQGATHLYSLADFPIRNNEIKKHYLQGRFGAIPFLGGADRLAAVKEPTLK